MKFFELAPRQDFAGYWPEAIDGEISDPRIRPDCRRRERIVSEYLGEPKRKPAKKGDFHKSAYSFFASIAALTEMLAAARGHLQSSPTQIIGREDEQFHQIWVTNYVDCLNLALTSASVTSSRDPTKIGVIKKPVFDEDRWDGSELFVLPQDPNYRFFCSEQFVARWREAKLKGALFTRYLMDPQPVRC